MAHGVKPGAPRVGIIGGGWAGLACAVRLTQAGAEVTVFEAAPTLGGRARGLMLDGRQLDNGQHILIGAYTETLTMLATVGVAVDDALLRLPLELHFPGELKLKAPRLPAPFHTLWALLAAQGLGWHEKFAAARFMGHLAWRGLGFSNGFATDTTVRALLSATAQPERLVRLVWEPLCVAALNTPIEEASARCFAAVLNDALTGRRAHSDLLLARTDLGALFPQPAARWLSRRGAQIHTDTRITHIASHDTGIRLGASGLEADFDKVVVATAPHHAAKLLNGLADTRALEGLTYEPILTCYLQYASSMRLAAPMVGVDGGTAQWLFDRGQITQQPGLIAAIISARGQHLALDKNQLVERIHDDICRTGGPTPAPIWHQVITEKRATHACRAHSAQPAMQTTLPGLYLCGDYLDPRYPATLEAACRSANQLARLLTP